MPTCITKMYCSDMSDPPMAASSKASVASAGTCDNYYTDNNYFTIIKVVRLKKHVALYTNTYILHVDHFSDL